jgi:hypothetical protein
MSEAWVSCVRWGDIGGLFARGAQSEVTRCGRARLPQRNVDKLRSTSELPSPSHIKLRNIHSSQTTRTAVVTSLKKKDLEIFARKAEAASFALSLLPRR